MTDEKKLPQGVDENIQKCFCENGVMPEITMTLSMNQSVQRVAEFMLKTLRSDELVAVSSSLATLAPLLWGNGADQLLTLNHNVLNSGTDTQPPAN